MSKIRTCCKVGCERVTDYEIWHGSKHDDYADACAEHVGDLLTDAPMHSVVSLYPSSLPADNAEIERLRAALEEIRVDAFLLGTAINERDPYDELFVLVNNIMRHVNTVLSSKEPTP